MRLIGLGGTNGSGKDELGHILNKDFGFVFVNVSEFLREEAKKKGLTADRENLRAISAQWRRQFGLAVLVDMANDFAHSQNQNPPGVIISAIRNSGEAKRLKELGGSLVWVDAQPRLRYERVTGRGRDLESKLTYEQFMSDEAAEMNSQDEASLDMAAVKKMADIFIQNDGSLEELKKKITSALGLA